MGRARPVLAGLRSDPKIAEVQPDAWIKWIEDEPASLQETPLPTLDSALDEFGPRLYHLRALPPPPPKLGDGEARWGVKRVRAPEAWPTNQGEGVKVAVIDTGVDGKHPDLKGRVAEGFNAINPAASWADDHFHGTHVAGIVAAELDGTGVVGVAPKARLYPVKAVDREGRGSVFFVVKAIAWATGSRGAE